MLDKNKKILIVGLGLMGGSYALALKEKGYRVGVVTRSPGTIRYALEQGMIDEGTTALEAAFVGAYDLVVFALYPHLLLEWLEKYQGLLRPGALLTDVTGVKSSVVYRVQQMLRSDVEFIGAHPMAGRELSGVQYADAGIFRGANYIVTPTAANTESAIAICEELGRTLGFARISRLSPEKHDEMVGFLSQLTHCIAVSLMTCRDTEHLSAYTGDSFRDLTRIARINGDMWSELFLLNKEELLRQIGLFTTQLDALKTAIENDDTDTLKEMMRLSTERRAFFDK